MSEEDVVGLAVKYNLVTSVTSLVAVETRDTSQQHTMEAYSFELETGEKFDSTQTNNEVPENVNNNNNNNQDNRTRRLSSIFGINDKNLKKAVDKSRTFIRSKLHNLGTRTNDKQQQQQLAIGLPFDIQHTIHVDFDDTYGFTVFLFNHQLCEFLPL